MNARELALEALNKITNEDAYSNLVINDFLRKYNLRDEDTAFFSKLVYGSLQNLIYLDYQIEPYLRKKQKPWVLNLLRLSFYQIIFLAVPDYASINEAVIIAKKKNAAIGSFVNAVLRNFQRNGIRSLDNLEAERRLSIKYSYPLWLVSKFINDYGIEDTEKIMATEEEERPLFIRINNLLTKRDYVLENLEKDNFKYQETILDSALKVYGAVQKTKMFHQGKITIQDLSAQFVAHIASPNKDDRILDLCAAPGGKAAHLADLMDNEGEIIACDIHPHKIKLMENGFKRLNVRNVLSILLDAKEALNKFGSGTFDLVLADVPCSGLGLITHKADLKYRINPSSIEEIIELQKEILDKTWDLVKPGGAYLYSTCTLNKDENEFQISKFLKEHHDAEIIEEKKIMPYEFQSDGFYICKIRRII